MFVTLKKITPRTLGTPPMATFHQEKMVAHGPVYQADVINIGQISTLQDAVTLIDRLRLQLAQAGEQGALDPSRCQAAQAHLTQAIVIAQGPQPDKKTIRDRLETAAKIIK